MVRCHVCGKEVISGWICGIVPAHDTDKLGLCPEHDTVQNRAAVEQAWEGMLTEALRATLERARRTVKTAVCHDVRIVFIDGGIKYVRCTSFDVNDAKDLLILTLDGEYEFYPLQHIRTFTTQETRLEAEEARSGEETAAQSLPAAPLKPLGAE